VDNIIEVEGKQYSIGKMNTITQFHVVRRLSPLVPTIISFMESPKENRKIGEMFYPLINSISALSAWSSNKKFESALVHTKHLICILHT